MTGQDERDVAIVGAGHNGLVAATLLARNGLSVTVLERADIVGGAVRTEYPFAAVPRLGASTGAYLLGLMPPELLELLDLDLPLIRRDPHYHLPLLDGGALTLGSDPDRNRAEIEERFGAAEAAAVERYEADLAALRDDLAPAWLAPPSTVEETAARYVRPELRARFLRLVRGSVGDHLRSYGFTSPLLMAMYAVTDGFPGIHGTWDTPGTGHNLLVHSSARLPDSDGTWMVVEGGMGTVSAALADAARSAGAEIVTSAEVSAVLVEDDAVRGIVADGEPIPARVVVVATDPWRLTDLVGARLVPSLAGRLDDYARRPGTTLKVNLALRDLPALPDRDGRNVHGATIHLLPWQDEPIDGMIGAFRTALDGRLPEEPAIELYIHTAVDGSLRDPDGHHSAALFVQWVPNRVEGGWDTVGQRYADHLLELVGRFSPGVAELVVDRQVLHPQAIERHFGITGGNIFHVDNTFAFDQRVPYRLDVAGLYACGAGCHPAGSVIGAAGHNAARCVVEDLA
ncbi:MAG: NAD(P)/FAD-dependent oxidoreductase [Nitriliruptorales bacterium]|nr:NAD(P)/FAD-dependent oxidoreductase [Nitriliruptorales bacterium]